MNSAKFLLMVLRGSLGGLVGALIYSPIILSTVNNSGWFRMILYALVIFGVVFGAIACLVTSYFLHFVKSSQPHRLFSHGSRMLTGGMLGLICGIVLFFVASTSSNSDEVLPLFVIVGSLGALFSGHYEYSSNESIRLNLGDDNSSD